MHFLTFDKEEMITLLALINEGAEAIRSRVETGDSLARAKHDASSALLGELNERIMRAVPGDE